MAGLRPLILLSPAEADRFAAATAAAGLVLPCTGQALAALLARRGLQVSPAQAARLAQGLAAVDALQMAAAGPGRPRVRDLIARRTLRYSPRDPDEWWQTWRDIYGQLQATGRATADCEDLAGLWSAEMRIDGWDPRAHPLIYRVDGRLSHVVVRAPAYDWRTGYTVIDPSRLAGMGHEEQ